MENNCVLKQHSPILLRKEGETSIWIATDGGTLTRLAGWQNMHNLPYLGGITDDVYSDLFKTLGENEQGVQNYFRHRATRLKHSPALALDTTTMSTYSS